MRVTEEILLRREIERKNKKTKATERIRRLFSVF